MAIRSCGCATTQTRPPSRRWSRQIEQGSASVRSQQIEQKRIFCRTSPMAADSAAASSGEARNIWKASRAAVFSPTPGSLASCWISRAIGEANIRGLGPEHPGGDGEAAGHLRQLRVGQLARALERDVHRAGRQVLDHLLVAHDGVVDREREDLPLAVGGAAAETSAGLTDDRLAPELFAHTRHLGLNALSRLEQPLEIWDRHQVLISLSAAPKTSCALRMRGCWRASFSRSLRSAVAASTSCPTSERTAVPLAGAPANTPSLVGLPSTDEMTASISAASRSARSASRFCANDSF